VIPKFISPADPAARWTGAHGGQAFFAQRPRPGEDTIPAQFSHQGLRLPTLKYARKMTASSSGA